MKLIRTKEQETALKRITALQIIFNRLIEDNPKFFNDRVAMDSLTMVMEHLAELAYTVGGIPGVNKVKNSVEKWSEKNG